MTSDRPEPLALRLGSNRVFGFHSSVFPEKVRVVIPSGSQPVRRECSPGSRPDRFVLDPSSEPIAERIDRRSVLLDPTERPQYRTVGARCENEVACPSGDDACPSVDEPSDESRPRVGEQNRVPPRQRPCLRHPEERELLIERPEQRVDIGVPFGAVDVGQSALDDIDHPTEDVVDPVVVAAFRGTVRIDRDVPKRERQIVVDVCVDPSTASWIKSV